MAEQKDESNVGVTYWAGRGKAEQSRLLLAAAGVKFKNNFISKPEDLKELRASGYVYNTIYHHQHIIHRNYINIWICTFNI